MQSRNGSPSDSPMPTTEKQAGEGPPPGRFVIVTLPRSGSYHLVSLLGSAKDVVCHGEVFKRERIELGAWHLEKMKVKAEDVGLRDEKPLKFLDRLRSLNGRKIFGFKLFPQHLGNSTTLRDQLLGDSSWKKIFLFRNPVESYASLLRAQSTGVWVLQAGSKVQEERLHAPVSYTHLTLPTKRIV